MIDPSYTEEDFLRLIDHVKKIDIDQPVFSIVTPFPGTPLYEEIKDQIITKNYEYFDGMHALTTTAQHILFLNLCLKVGFQLRYMV